MRRVVMLTVLMACSTDATKFPDDCSAISILASLGPQRAVPPVAVGGRVGIRAGCPTSGNQVTALQVPYEVESDASVMTATRTSAGVDLFGIAPGTTHLHIKSASTEYSFDESFELSAVAIDSIVLDDSSGHQGPAWAWTPGEHTVQLRLNDDAGDDDASWSSPYKLTASEIEVDSPGVYTLAAHAGTFDATIPFTVSNTADSITTDDSEPVRAGRFATLCFEARDGALYLEGLLDWTFSVGGAVTMNDIGCVQFEPTLDQVGQTIEVIASTAGASLTLEVLVASP